MSCPTLRMRNIEYTTCGRTSWGIHVANGHQSCSPAIREAIKLSQVNRDVAKKKTNKRLVCGMYKIAY